MKKNDEKYPVVTNLPDNAMTVSAYAKDKGFTTNYVYNLIRDNREKAKVIPFYIVVFNSFNFIIPK